MPVEGSSRLEDFGWEMAKGAEVVGKPMLESVLLAYAELDAMPSAAPSGSLRRLHRAAAWPRDGSKLEPIC